MALARRRRCIDPLKWERKHTGLEPQCRSISLIDQQATAEAVCVFFPGHWCPGRPEPVEVGNE